MGGWGLWTGGRNWRGCGCFGYAAMVNMLLRVLTPSLPKCVSPHTIIIPRSYSTNILLGFILNHHRFKKKRLNFSKNPGKLSTIYRSFSNQSESLPNYRPAVHPAYQQAQQGVSRAWQQTVQNLLGKTQVWPVWLGAFPEHPRGTAGEYPWYTPPLW